MVQPTTPTKERRTTPREKTFMIRNFIVVVLIALYAYVQWFLLNELVNVDMREIVMRSLGTLDALLGLVVGYYFGSSDSGVKKTEIQAHRGDTNANGKES